jgi:hypothetical protein
MDELDDEEREMIAARTRNRGKRRSSLETHQRISEISGATGSVDPMEIIQQLLVRVLSPAPIGCTSTRLLRRRSASPTVRRAMICVISWR